LTNSHLLHVGCWSRGESSIFVTPTRTVIVPNEDDGVSESSTVAGAKLSDLSLRQNGEAFIAGENGCGDCQVTEDELELLEHWCGDLITRIFCPSPGEES